MELSIKDFYLDLFSSYKYNKKEIDDQIERDFDRLVFYFNNMRIVKKSHFYEILRMAKLSQLYKRLIWILPNQSTLFPFYQYLYLKYKKQNQIISEISDSDKTYNNNFTIHLELYKTKYPHITIRKNFRIIGLLDGGKIETIGYIFLIVEYMLGLDKMLNISINQEDLKVSRIE